MVVVIGLLHFSGGWAVDFLQTVNRIVKTGIDQAPLRRGIFQGDHKIMMSP